MADPASFAVVPVDVLDPAAGALFAAWNATFTAVDRAVFGPSEQGWTLEELRGKATSPYAALLALAAVDRDGRVVGAARVELPTEDNGHLANATLAVDPATPAPDLPLVAGPLLAEVETRVREAGRSVLLIENQTATEGVDALGEGFLARHGFVTAQTDVRSELPLPADADRLAALAQAGPGGAAYGLETAVDRMPPSWLVDRARLQARMSTDAPLGDVPLEPEEWTPTRMRDWVQQTLDSGRRYVETVVRHADTGPLVGFTTLTVSAGDPTLAYQWDTLVLSEHRGHGLGLRLKAANALALQREAPTVTRIRTWNADDNAHMLAVNTTLGFRPVGALREWQKKLTA